MITYTIKTAFAIDRNICPPFIVEQLFPGVAIERVQMDAENLLVTVPGGVTPRDLGPLVKVEEIQG